MTQLLRDVIIRCIRFLHYSNEDICSCEHVRRNKNSVKTANTHHSLHSLEFKYFNSRDAMSWKSISAGIFPTSLTPASCRIWVDILSGCVYIHQCVGNGNIFPTTGNRSQVSRWKRTESPWTSGGQVEYDRTEKELAPVIGQKCFTNTPWFVELMLIHVCSYIFVYI